MLAPRQGSENGAAWSILTRGLIRLVHDKPFSPI
jgi:hypothetical protein